MQNCKTVAQTLLGETAHFGFCPPKIGVFRGLGGVPKIFSSLESSYFCELGVHAQFQNCSTNPSGRNGQFKLLSIQNRLFGGARGGPRNFFLHWNLHIFVTYEPMQKIKILRHPLLGETANFGFCPPKICFFRGLGGVPEFFLSHWDLHIFVT